MISSSSWDFVDDYNIPFEDGAFVVIEDENIEEDNITEDKIINSVLEGQLSCVGEGSYPVSPVHSNDSSDYDFLPLVDDDMELLCVSEFGSDLIESLNFDDLDWGAETSNETTDNVPTDGSMRYSSSIEVPKKKRQRSKKAEHATNTKSWSRMSIEERLKTAHALSQIVSQRMVLRDQVEVIKLINPAAMISPNTTEFSINIGHLNNKKLKRIRDYVRKHASLHKDEMKNSSFHELLLGSPKRSSSNCRPAKRKRKTCKSPEEEIQLVGDEIVMKEKKIKQNRKEQLSGLFVQETVVKLLGDPLEESEEVNILE